MLLTFRLAPLILQIVASMYHWQVSDAGTFECRASNKAGKDRLEFVIDVQGERCSIFTFELFVQIIQNNHHSTLII